MIRLPVLTFLTIFGHLKALFFPLTHTGTPVLDDFPLIDGHNDLAFNLHLLLNNRLEDYTFDADLSRDPLFRDCDSCQTDWGRLTRGKVGAQFWTAFVDCHGNQEKIVAQSIEQIDVIKRLVEKYPQYLQLVTTADGIIEAFQRHKLASLIGLEGGHSIDNRLAILRQFYDLGVRYMTLTHDCNLPWADSWTVDADNTTNVNLTNFGKEIILEMNRLGMIVDLSHTSHSVQLETIRLSRAPVIFSHSGAYSIYPTKRNVKDDILLQLRGNDGIIMVSFVNTTVGGSNVTIKDVIKHINYIVDVIGINHVGLGSDFDGGKSFPIGLEDPSKLPDLFKLLQQSNARRWTPENLQKLKGRNFYRVFQKVEEASILFKSQLIPNDNRIPDQDLKKMGLSSENVGDTINLSRLLFSFTIASLLFIIC